MRGNLMLIGLMLPLAAACGNSVDIGDRDDGRPGIPAQGTGGTRTYAAADFTAVELRGADNVDIRVGPGFSVRADGDSALLDHLKVSRDGNTLRVGRTSNWTWHGDRARISITMPRLTDASIAGSGDVTVDRVQGPAFKVSSAGSGGLTVGAAQLDQAELSLAGSGRVRIGGTAQRLTVNVAGSGAVDAGELHAGQADVSVAGSGSVRAAVDGPAKVSMMGSGNVDLGSKARCQVNKMGSGSVRCGG